MPAYFPRMMGENVYYHLSLADNIKQLK
jgi:hypothetical protein